MSTIMPIRVRNGKPARDPGAKNLPLPRRRVSGRPARLRRAARYRAAPAGAARDSNGPTDTTSDKTSRPPQALLIRYTVGTNALQTTRSMKQVGWPKTDHIETFNWARDWLARRLERSALAASAREVSVQRRSARSAAVGLRYDLRRPCARAATRAARCSRSLFSKSFSDSRLSASRSSTAGGGGGGALRGSAHGSSSATLG